MAVLQPKHLLVPTDFSDEAARAVEKGLSLVENAEQLTVLHVAPNAIPSEGDLMIGWDPTYDESRIERLRGMLRQKFSDRKYENVRFEVLFGTPATEIAKFAEKEQVDMIMLPSHGRTGLAHMMLGSVAERVVRLAHCPVLVLRD